MKYSLCNDTWDEKEINAAYKVIDSRYFTLGQNVREYETEFAEKFHSKYAVMTNSGSSANLIAIASLVYSGRINRGDEVLVTAVSWSTTYFPLMQLGLKIRFVDIDLNTLNVDISELKEAVTDKTRVIMAVNLLGNPNEFDKIEQICRDYGLLLVEDNCESMGAMYKGRCAGTFGIIGSFSTYFSHHICTMEGGVCLTDDEELYHYMLSIRSHGWTRHLPENSKIYDKLNDEFYESFNFIVPGFNVRPIGIEAATGREQLKKLDAFIEQRRKNAAYFIERLLKETNLKTQAETGMSSWFGFAIILPEEEIGRRDEYIKELARNEVETRPIVAGNFVKQKAVEFMDYSIYGNLQNASYIHDNGFFAGNHSIPMEHHIDLLIDVLARVESRIGNKK